MADEAEVTEELLMHLRITYGSWVATLPLPIAVARYPWDFFTGTWIAFADDLPMPTQYGSGPKGADALEIVAVLAFTQSLPPLAADLTWLALDHQCGGINCNHFCFVGTRLKLRPEIYPVLRKIARDRWPLGPHDHISKDDEKTYATQKAAYKIDLKALSLSCDTVEDYLTESLYPIDATQENLERIAENPPRIFDLIATNEQSSRGANLAIFILTANSD
jgi:hypothetical protein